MFFSLTIKKITATLVNTDAIGFSDVNY